MTLADTLFVSRLGPAALSGVGLGSIVAFSLLGFSFGLLRAVKTLVSQAVGAGRVKHVDHYLAAGVLLAVCLGLLGTLLGFLLSQILPMFMASPASGAYARTYLSIRMLGAVPMLVYVALREARYGLGDAKTPMRASVIGNLLNIVLDYYLVVVVQRGVAGAAWATVAGGVLEALYLICAQSKHGFRFVGLRRNHIAATVRLGVPTGLQFVLEIGAFSVLSLMLAALSEIDMAAHQIAIQVIHFSFMPAMALSEACAVLAGQAVGARREFLVRLVAHKGLMASSIYTGLGTIVFSLGAYPITSFFTRDAALSLVTVQLLYVAAVFQIFDGANVIARGTLRGTGDVNYSAVICVVTAWALTPPVGWFLAYRMNLGAFGGWLALSGEIIIAAVVLWYRLERQGWWSAAQRTQREMKLGEYVDKF